jgi:hypothetical protein
VEALRIAMSAGNHRPVIGSSAEKDRAAGNKFTANNEDTEKYK